MEVLQNYKKIIEEALDANNITSFAIVAYGRDFISDVSASSIEFYY